MSRTNPKVDFFFRDKRWAEAYEKLRTIVLDCGLTEELKWGCPCYTLGKKNIVLIHGFKDYCALLFFKGALLKDPKGILIQQTKNVQVPRQIRFTNAREISKMKTTITAYVKEAMQVEKAGVKLNLKKTNEFSMPEEFQAELKKDPALKSAFNALTPGRQRGYLLYFSAPKQSQTRRARVEKSMPRILKGEGLND